MTPTAGPAAPRPTRREVLLGVLGIAGVVGALVVVFAVSRPWAFDHLGPWLATFTAGQRAGLGLLTGTAAAAPLLLRLPPRAGRALRWPVTGWLVLAGLHLLWVWMPLKGASDDAAWESHWFRSEVDVFIPMALLGFGATGLVLGTVVGVVGVRRARRDRRHAGAATG